MKKLALTLTATTLLLTGLAGCGNTNNDNVNEGASGSNKGFGVNEESRGLGFSDSDYGMDRDIPNSNKTRRYNGSGKNDGNQRRDQIQGYGDEGNGIRNRDGLNSNRVEGQNRDQNIAPYGKGRNNGNNFDHKFYDGRTNNDLRQESGEIRGQGANKKARNGYFDGDDGRLSREINDSLSDVKGLRNSHVIVHENDVIIGVEHDKSGKNMDRVIKEHVKSRTGNRNVHVVTDRDQVNNLRGMNERLEMGEPFEEIGATLNDMLKDLGNAVQRPFERSR